MIAQTSTLVAGDLLIGTASGKRRFDSRVVAIEPCPVGMPVRGPRGGMYRLTAEGARKYLIVRLANGTSPLVPAASNVTIYRASLDA